MGAHDAALGAHLQAAADRSIRIAIRLLLLPPANGKRPGLLDRCEVLIQFSVGLAVLNHQAVPPVGVDGRRLLLIAKELAIGSRLRLAGVVRFLRRQDPH